MDPLLMSEIFERLKQKFTEFDIDFDVLCNLLIENNAFISGSFLLQVIQNRFFEGEDYDIDIFTFGNKNVSFEKNIKKLIKNAVMKKTGVMRYDGKIINMKDYYLSDNEDHYDTCNVRIIDKYKGINRCTENDLLMQTGSYIFQKIKEVVDFESILCKHQLIYFDEQMYKKPTDVTDTFDFDFCANYFDGKNIYIKNLDSITSAACTLNLKQLRIYNNENKRIVKYMKRGYYINAKYGEDIYEIAHLSTNKNNELDIMFKGSTDTKNLIIICEYFHLNSSNYLNITNYLNNLSFDLEKIVIYTYYALYGIDNLPITVQELKLYIWKKGNGTESNITQNRKYSNSYLKNAEAKYKFEVKFTMDNIQKIPFNCKVYINDELMNS